MCVCVCLCMGGVGVGRERDREREREREDERERDGEGEEGGSKEEGGFIASCTPEKHILHSNPPRSLSLSLFLPPTYLPPHLSLTQSENVSDSIAHVKEGNEQLRSALQHGVTYRVWVLLLFVVAGLSLLFLDQIYD